MISAELIFEKFQKLFLKPTSKLSAIIPFYDYVHGQESWMCVQMSSDMYVYLAFGSLLHLCQTGLPQGLPGQSPHWPPPGCKNWQVGCSAACNGLGQQRMRRSGCT